ncbi:exo-alpha-sialidase [Bremerella cremea]|uniref:Sialidase n=1 Tax=Blastopirellula marina TaxID=124 RepID=A0A2S8FQU1_9BACT|nr:MULTISPECIES: sialidase family protein [Pirellulaceae]PQO34543.1 sialidase [Blastopirellula marina]RCS47039.1 exo-alpha-sialidase [Bremerella cremea]
MQRTSLLLLLLFGLFASPSLSAAETPKSSVVLPPGPANPRNSEGDVVQLKDGNVLLVYTHFDGGSGDHAKAHLASRISEDGGKTWSEEDKVVVENEAGLNVMSVSLLRLADGRLALFYLRKNSHTDCRPYMRISTDEGKTWGEPVTVIGEKDLGYYILNNDRAVQLSNGRLVLPVAQHVGPGMPKRNNAAAILVYYSDDAGETWQRSEYAARPPKRNGQDVISQEPGVVELKDGRLMMWIRTNAGSQFVTFSRDKGDTWSQLKPSDMKSPLAPATIERIPTTGDLLLIWNDHSEIPDALKGKRTPLCSAISKDDGQTWTNVKTLEDNPHGWYCYIALDFIEGNAVMAYCAGDRRENNGLAVTNTQCLPIDWFYETE